MEQASCLLGRGRQAGCLPHFQAGKGCLCSQKFQTCCLRALPVTVIPPIKESRGLYVPKGQAALSPWQRHGKTVPKKNPPSKGTPTCAVHSKWWRGPSWGAPCRADHLRLSLRAGLRSGQYFHDSQQDFVSEEGVKIIFLAVENEVLPGIQDRTPLKAHAGSRSVMS